MRYLIFFLLASSSLNAQHPFKYDSLYNTIFSKQLCELLQKDPNVQLIDVRSPGEYGDTSRWASLNIGHLKGAVNIQIDTLLKNIGLLKPYQGKTIVFYCSHSQRSRKASKFLYENGWNNFYNLNGGMSSLLQLNAQDFPCKLSMIETSMPYKNLNLTTSAKLIDAQKDLVIIDARTSAQFNANDTLERNNLVRLRKAINIPYDGPNTNLKAIDKYKNKSVLVYAASGDGNGARLAKLLTEKGFKNVQHLLGGIQDFATKTEHRKYIETPTPFIMLDALGALALLKSGPNIAIIDARSDNDFNNKNGKDKPWMNLGHIKNAVHMPEMILSSIPGDGQWPIFVYGGEHARKVAAMFCREGFKNVYLMENFGSFVWSSFNVEACKENLNFLVDHEGLY
jgi:rhodanese-related sulfurtransferase